MNKKNIIFSAVMVFLLLSSISIISYTVKATNPNVEIQGEPDPHITHETPPVIHEQEEEFWANIANHESYTVTIVACWRYNGTVQEPNQTMVLDPNSQDHKTETRFQWTGEVNETQYVTLEIFWNNISLDNATWSGFAVKTKVSRFNSISTGETPELWASSPSYMADGLLENYASTSTVGDVELLNGNTCTESESGSIKSVWLRTKGYYSGIKHTIKLRPVFGGVIDGLNYEFEEITTSATWSEWFDITNDPSAPPETWVWPDVDNLDCDVVADGSPSSFTLYCSQVEIRVCYID